MIDQLASGREEERTQSWNDFVESYWPVLVSWIQKRGLSRQEAEDLVQGLMLKLWEGKDFSSQLSREHSRLRVYLSTALQNWWFDEHRKKSRLKRGAGAEILPLDEKILPADISSAMEKENFDQEWAIALVNRATALLRNDYASRSNEAFFDAAFPLIGNPDELQREALRQRFDMEKNTMTVALKRLRERLIQRVREEVRATLIEPSEDEIRGEVTHLLAALASAGGLQTVAPQASRS